MNEENNTPMGYAQRRYKHGRKEMSALQNKGQIRRRDKGSYNQIEPYRRPDKGHQEDGESDVETATRETREETGLDDYLNIGSLTMILLLSKSTGIISL